MGALHRAMHVSMSIALLCSSGFAMRSATRKLWVRSAVHKKDGQKVKHDVPLGAAPGSLAEVADKIEAEDVHNRTTEAAEKVGAKYWHNRTAQVCETGTDSEGSKMVQLCEAYVNAIRRAPRQKVAEHDDFKARILQGDQDIQGCTLEQAREKCEKHWCQISQTSEACMLFQEVADGKVWDRELTAFGKQFQSYVNGLERTAKKQYMACTLDSFWRKCQIDKPVNRPCKVTPLCEKAEGEIFGMKRAWKAMSDWIKKNHLYQECKNQKPRVFQRECLGSEHGCFANLFQEHREYVCGQWNQATDKESLLDGIWKNYNAACNADEMKKYCSR